MPDASVFRIPEKTLEMTAQFVNSNQILSDALQVDQTTYLLLAFFFHHEPVIKSTAEMFITGKCPSH